MEKPLLLEEHSRSTADYFFDQKGNFMPEKLLRYSDDVLERYTVSKIDSAIQSSSINFGLEWCDLISVMVMAGDVKACLAEVEFVGIENIQTGVIISFLNWDNMQRNGLDITNPDYIPLSLLDNELFEVYKLISDLSNQQLINSFFKDIKVS